MPADEVNGVAFLLLTLSVEVLWLAGGSWADEDDALTDFVSNCIGVCSSSNALAELLRLGFRASVELVLRLGFRSTVELVLDALLSCPFFPPNILYLRLFLFAFVAASPDELGPATSIATSSSLVLPFFLRRNMVVLGPGDFSIVSYHIHMPAYYGPSRHGGLGARRTHESHCEISTDPTSNAPAMRAGRGRAAQKTTYKGYLP